MLTTAEKVDARRYCGYGMFGLQALPANGYRFSTAYGTLEYKLNNMLPEEEAVFRTTYVANLALLETDIPAFARTWTRIRPPYGRTTRTSCATARTCSAITAANCASSWVFLQVLAWVMAAVSGWWFDMDGTKLQAKIYKGYGQAAKRIGFDYQQFRATSASNPLQSTALQTLPASFTTNFRYSAPNKYGQATWLGLFDARTFEVSDFLVGRQGTFFVAAMQDTLPIYCVQTNRTVSVLRDAQDQSVGIGAYSGGTRATEVALMTGWPASILQGTKGETNDAKLPLDVKTPWWAILMPAYPGIILRTSDVIRDELGRKYVISSAELTDMGWRITAMQAQV